ncbi:hypothetical protein EIK77_000856 [Talaromyces pinophilus]|nr:hypothetical protein EIK77_000856 [Talaromyces pinophilus]
MAGPVNLQADVGDLSLRSLNVARDLLQILSADDVAPLAVEQMESLGAAFPLSGPLLFDLPDHLQRTSSHRLESLGLMIGWKKGDTASLLATSAGGQAISLLATCLYNICGEETGHILKQLSRLLLPAHLNVASPSQLQRVSQVVSQKLAVIGFGNHLARQTHRIHAVYEQLGKSTPEDLLRLLSAESLVDLFDKFSKAIREEGFIITAKGSSSMGYIVAIAVMMFAEDTTVTVEGLVIYEGPRQAIHINVECLNVSQGSLVQLQLASELQSTNELVNLIHKKGSDIQLLQYKYAGWLGDMTRLTLLGMGYGCSIELLEMVALILFQIVAFLSIDPVDDSFHSRRAHYRQMKHHLQMAEGDFIRNCEQMLGVSLPTTSNIPSFMALGGLGLPRWFEDKVKSWYPSDQRMNNSLKGTTQAIWRVILKCALQGLPALYIRAHENATWQVSTLDLTLNRKDFRYGIYSRLAKNEAMGFDIIRARDLMQEIYQSEIKEVLAISSSSTIIPRSLLQLQDNPLESEVFELYDGQILFEDRPQTALICACELTHGLKSMEQPPRRRSGTQALMASSDGVPSKVSFRLTEGFKKLYLHCLATDCGEIHELCLKQPTIATIGLCRTDPCQHPHTRAPKTCPKSVWVTSTVCPDAPDENLAIVQTVGSPTAQFLAMNCRRLNILCQGCCVDCALNQSRDFYFFSGTVYRYDKIILT